jgi:hypothetical protein
MRNKTQERIEELAAERGVTAIDLALVEDGIEFGKRMMAEMIATYSPPGAGASADTAAAADRNGGTAPVGAGNAGSAAGADPGAASSASPSPSASPAPAAPSRNGSGYLNEVNSRTPPRP